MFKDIIRICLCLVLLAGWTGIARAAPYTDIVVFGDSLSDNGNVSFASFGFVPGDPYFDGRFSNGFVYADYLAQSYGLDHQPFLSGGSNYAFGGALTDDHTSGFLPSVINQVQIHGAQLRIAGAVPDPDALYVVWGGGNNLLDTISSAAGASDPGAVALAGISNAVQDIAFITAMLASFGVDQVLIPNMPDLGRIPRSLDDGNSAIGTAISSAFNQVLDNILPLLSWIDVIMFDTFSVMGSAIDDPATYGFTNVTDTCLTGGLGGYLGGGDVCANPAGYMFWDDIHPTTRTHEYLAGAMRDLLDTLSPSASLAVAGIAIPEPRGTMFFVLGLFVLIAFRKRSSSRS